MKLINSLVVSACAAASAAAAPFLAVDDNAEIFLTGLVGVDVNDNITMAEDELEDTILLFTPGASFEFGKNALTTGSLSFQETIMRYSDHDEFDAELSNAIFGARYMNGKTAIGVNASWAQLNQNTVDTRLANPRVLSRRDVTTLVADGEWGISEKSAVMVGGDYRNVDYKRPGFVDSERLQVPVRYFYEMTPKVDLTFGATYRETTLAGAGNDSDDQFYSLGARGDFTPKLTGALLVGYTRRDNETGEDRGALGLDARFTYFYSPKTTFNVGIGNDFGNSGTGESQENFDLSFAARSEVAPDLAIVARVMYRSIDNFVRPDDDYTEGHVGAEYMLNRHVSFSGGYTYRKNQSDLAGGDFENSVFSLAARLRY